MDLVKSYKIPDKNEFIEKKQFFEETKVNKNHEKSDDTLFAEIEIPEFNYTVNIPVSTPVPQAENHVFDEKRTMIYNMRQIAKNNTTLYFDDAKLFYKQAFFMKDFEDDFCEEYESFSSYHPYYEKMTYAQIRSYFTWRTKVRNGDIENISVSYAFIYIYELLNNIGVENPQDGLDKLMTFWKAFREFDSVIDRYVVQWLKDYHIFYELKSSFKEFIRENNLQIYYPTVCAFDSGRIDSLELYADVSKYKIMKSAFYTEKNREIIRDYFYFVLTRLRSICKENNKCFEDFIFQPLAVLYCWKPFGSALFYSDKKIANRQVTISDREVYTCNNNTWMYNTVGINDKGRYLISYIIKETEASLRNLMNFKRKLSTDTTLCGRELLQKLESIGIVFPVFIQKSVSDYYNLLNRKAVTVDITNLKQIRQDAFITQEKLIVPENENKQVNNDIKSTNNEIIVFDKIISDDEVIKISHKNEVKDIWSEFIDGLNQKEFEAIKVILLESNGNFKEFAAKNGYMPEVLADNINQKAVDFVGDTILEFDETVYIYDEYIENLTKAVKN